MRYFYFALFYNIVSRLALPISCFYVAIRLNALNGHKYFWSLQTFYHYHFVYSIWLYCSVYVYTPVWMTECYGIWFSLRGIYGRAYLLHGFFFLVLVHCVMYVLKNLHWGNVTIDVIFRILFQFISLYSRLCNVMCLMVSFYIAILNDEVQEKYITSIMDTCIFILIYRI